MSTFNTVDEIRSDIGIDGNTNVEDDDLEVFLNEANGVICSYVGSYYDIAYLDPTATGISGSTAEQTLKRMEKTLAKAYFYQRSFGYETDTKVMGFEIEGQIKDELEKIKNGDMKLFDSNNNELARVSGALAGVPDGEGFEDDEEIFSVDDEY